MFYSIFFAVIVGIWAFYLVLRKRTLKGNVILGPKGFPLIGCVREVNEDNICFKLTEFAETFGDIFRFKMFSDNLVVLNSQEMIQKAFADDKYKRHFNDRARMFYGEYFRFHNQSLGFVTEGFGMFHKVARQQFVKAVHTYGSGLMDLERNVMKEMNLLVNRIENMPNMTFQCMDLFKRSLSNIVSLVLSGELINDNDPDIDIFWRHVRGNDFFLSSATNSIMTSFPFLRFLPGKYGDEYRNCKQANEKIRQKYFYKLKNTYIPGKCRGLVDHYIEEQRKEMAVGGEIFFTDERIIAQIIEIVDAGISTTWSFLTNSMLVLLNHPEIQAKIQAEIDTVIGKERSPTYSDRNNCHYLRAFEMEIHRYLTIAPFLVPHLCKDHVEFCGYDIEPKSLILANIWYVHHDKEVWGDPWTVRPERFLDEQGELLPREHKLCKSVLAFGYGQRQCTGAMFAKTRAFLYMATLLQRWSFEFPKDMERSCDPRTPDSFDLKGIIKSKPFLCMAKKRFQQ
ncbi:cytochrome P450 2C31-like [Mercenaria mercenaria]|uniref:cytochrome P450 2C31-like n=1 Tax=Mercenaria mercenaria TaxID=6596 RepID=UPI00234E53FE|nr:cytochrome P450 2C31-like [Mercenaria mercenaria]